MRLDLSIGFVTSAASEHNKLLDVNIGDIGKIRRHQKVNYSDSEEEGQKRSYIRSLPAITSKPKGEPKTTKLKLRGQRKKKNETNKQTV